MSDEFYKKQLESFGIESTRITQGDLEKKRLEEQLESSLGVIKGVMETMQGRQWLYSILNIARVFTSPFAPGQQDVTAFFSGMQALGHKLLADIMRAAPEKYYLMIQEEDARKRGAEIRAEGN